MSEQEKSTAVENLIENGQNLEAGEEIQPTELVQVNRDLEPKFCFCLEMGDLSVRGDFKPIRMAAHGQWRAVACTDGFVHIFDTSASTQKALQFSNRYRAEIMLFPPESIRNVAMYKDNDAGELYLAYSGDHAVVAMRTDMSTPRWRSLVKGYIVLAEGNILKCQKGIKELVWRPGPDGKLCLYIHGNDGRIFRFQKKTKWRFLRRLHRLVQHEDLHRPDWCVIEV